MVSMVRSSPATWSSTVPSASIVCVSTGPKRAETVRAGLGHNCAGDLLVVEASTGCKPPAADPIGRSASPSPCSSYQPSPRASYNSSSFPSSGSSSQITLGGGSGFFGGVEGSSLIPWLRNLSSPGGSHFASPSKFPVHHHRPYYFNGGSISAPVTPPSGSPPRTPRLKTGGLGEYPGHVLPPWAGASYASLPNSTPPSPGRKVAPDPAWLAGFQISSAGPSSPTYSLVAPTYNPFASSSRMCTPGQSGTCSPVVGGAPMAHGDVEMIDGAGHEFAFGSGRDVGDKMPGLVKPWEGERIHEECVSDELELTLGSSRTRADHP